MSPLRRLIVLSLLYICEGLPYGFQAIALPVYLRSEGVSLTSIGFLGVLGLPWLLKPLWAPWVDAHGSRRAWIRPCLALLAATAGAAAWAPPHESLALLLALVFLMNVFAATLDVAVDGLAVDVLPEDALGSGNIAQVVGYKVGMLGGGGLLVWASQDIGWSGLFGGMSGFVVVVFVALWPLIPAETLRPERPRQFGGVLRAMLSTLKSRSALCVLALTGTYKLGETLTDVMWKPYLVDAGYTPAELGWVLGTLGLSCALLGSFAGGLWVTQVGPRRALAHTALLRIFPLALLAGLASLRSTGIEVSRFALEAGTMAENFFGGSITTAMMAFMMSRVDRRIGAAHFALLAAVEVLGKVPAGLLSGALTDAVGYPAVFALATLLSVGFSVAIPFLAPTSKEKLRPAL